MQAKEDQKKEDRIWEAQLGEIAVIFIYILSFKLKKCLKFRTGLCESTKAMSIV